MFVGGGILDAPGRGSITGVSGRSKLLPYKQSQPCGVEINRKSPNLGERDAGGGVPYSRDGRFALDGTSACPARQWQLRQGGSSPARRRLVHRTAAQGEPTPRRGRWPAFPGDREGRPYGDTGVFTLIGRTCVSGGGRLIAAPTAKPHVSAPCRGAACCSRLCGPFRPPVKRRRSHLM